jgi:hydroxymethylpyrimidine pyrophosphatase-like HAD family hydrolase
MTAPDMTVLLALDLDQTLIFSARSAGDVATTPTIWVEEYDGAPISLMTTAAYDLLARLGERHTVMPVTTRTPAQLGRVRLPGSPALAVCANGGVLLREGVRDPVWDATVATSLRDALPAAQVFQRLNEAAARPWVKSVRQVEELFVYLVAHERDVVPAEWVDDLRAWAEGGGWTVSVQGRKIYAVPLALNKGAAAARVASELDLPLLAAGDSLLDRPLLQVAERAARPSHGELHAENFQLPTLYVSPLSGAASTEDVLRFLAQQAELLRV